MTAADRPWWATEGDATPDVDHDPLEAHRAARRGPGPDETAPSDEGDSAHRGQVPDDGSWWGPATEAMSRLARDLAATAGAATSRVAASGPAGSGPSASGPSASGTSASGTSASGAATDRDRAANAADPADAVAGAAGPGAGRNGTNPGGGSDGGADDGHRIDACGICPICVGLRVIGDARPDLVGHLAEAARQLALAVRTVVDAAAPDSDAASEPGSGSRPPGRRAGEYLHRIDLDD